MPLLIATDEKITHRFKVTPSRNFWGSTSWTVEPGGWAVGVFYLEVLYVEHKVWRNNWSDSNSGLDLARYRGTKLTLNAHADYSYIFWWDTDYNDPTAVVNYAHPAIMLNKQNHVIVPPSKITGKLSKKIFIPPPSVMESDWRFSKDLTDTGLFVFATALIDIAYPFTPNDPALWTGDQTNEWWYHKEGDNNAPRWLLDWGQEGKETMKWVKWGPFVRKYLPSHTSINISCTYVSHWEFGGEVLPHETVSDPREPQVTGRARLRPIWDIPQPVHPRHPKKRTIQPKDLTDDGELRDSALRRICTTTDSSFTTVSSSDGEHSDSLCHRRRTRSTSPSAKKKAPAKDCLQAQKEKLKARETRHFHRHRVRGLSFDSFLALLEREHGRRLTGEEIETARGVFGGGKM